MAKHGLARALLEARLGEKLEPLEKVVAGLAERGGVTQSSLYSIVRELERTGQVTVDKHNKKAMVAWRGKPTAVLRCVRCGSNKELASAMPLSSRMGMVNGMLGILERNKALGLCWDVTIFGLCESCAVHERRPRKESRVSHRFLVGLGQALKFYGGIEWPAPNHRGIASNRDG